MKNHITLIIFFFCYYNTLGQNIDYNTQIQPIFTNSCMPCHQGNNPSGGLDLTSYENVITGGNSGDVIIIGDYENSILWQEVASGDMPNNIGNNTLGIPDLNAEEIELIQNWILDLQCMIIDCEFGCELGECIEDNTSLLESKQNKKLIKIIDILGREQKSTFHKDILLYMYEDGTTEKVRHIK